MQPITFTIPDPTSHAGLYLLAGMVLLGLVLARRVRAIRVLLSTALLASLAITLVATLDQRAGLDPRLARLVSLLRPGGQEIVGPETRVPLSADGHFWVRASIDGVERRMLIDSGATATTLSERTAREAGLSPRDGLFPVMLHTANGTVAAQTATVGELRAGNIVARDVTVIVARGIDMDVIGMNFLSRLKGWRVADGTLVLTPHHPQRLGPPGAGTAGD